MFKRWMVICAVFLAISLCGCSGNTAAAESSSERPSVMLGDTYKLPQKNNLTFYCMRVKDKYYKFLNTGSSAELLIADDPSLLPVIADGQFARVTADIEETYSSFGFVPNINHISTRIIKLRHYEPMEFEDITKVFNLPSPDSKEINKESKLFQYTYEGKIYLIFRFNYRVTAYSKNGLFIDYEPADKTAYFTEFFEALKSR